MCRLLALSFAGFLPLLLLAAPASPVAPNTLTPAEAAAGWLLLFDGQTTFGWNVEGEARVEKGVLVLGGAKATTAKTTAPLGGGLFSCEGYWQGKEAPTGTAGSAKFELTASKDGVFIGQQVKGEGGVAFRVPAGTRLALRNLRVQPQGMESLFDGKTLAGWKVFEGKGKKSRYSVTKEGYLNVQDGPGDIQTVKHFDDFVLQVECISNGKHLNSGIFFRCLPGLYQQGYEAQVRNQFTPEATQKYTIEEYDPKTNKLVGKKTILSPAVDYGTGAIYRRMPARRGVARDGAWFTLTVAARGRHLATWVDGFPVADWTDNRPANDNARQGYRAAAGAISIQGHDPTTNLSFRNMRIKPLAR